MILRRDFHECICLLHNSKTVTQSQKKELNFSNDPLLKIKSAKLSTFTLGPLQGTINANTIWKNEFHNLRKNWKKN